MVPRLYQGSLLVSFGDLLVSFGDQPVSRGDLSGGSARNKGAERVVGEYLLDLGRGADLSSDLLEVLRALGVGQEEDAHEIIHGTGRAVFVQSWSVGWRIRRLVQLIHQPLGERDFGGGSTQNKSAGPVVGKESPDVSYRANVSGHLLEALWRPGMGQEEDMHDVVAGQAVFVGLLGWVFPLVQQPLRQRDLGGGSMQCQRSLRSVDGHLRDFRYSADVGGDLLKLEVGFGVGEME